MSVDWLIFEICNSTFGIFMMTLLAKGLIKDNRFVKTSIKILMYILSIMISILVDIIFLDNMFVISFKTIVLIFIITNIFYKTKIYWTVICAFLFIVITGIAELSSSLIIAWAYNVEYSSVMDVATPRFYSILVTNFIVVFIIKTFTYMIKGKVDVLPIQIWIPLVLLSVFSMFTTIQIILASFADQTPYSFFSIIGVIGLLYSDIILFIFIENVLRRNEENKRLSILEAQLTIQKEHNMKLSENQFYTQQLAHDFKQHIQGFSHLCANKRYEELEKNIYLLSEQQECIKKVINTENPMLDALLTFKKEIAEKNGIHCAWNICISPNINIPIIELNSLLGNALDNAIEGCLRSNEEKVIIVQMRQDENIFLCEIKNTIGKMPKKKDDELETLKEDKKNHGIGLKSMIECCKKINGQMNFDYDNSILIISITELMFA